MKQVERDNPGGPKQAEKPSTARVHARNLAANWGAHGANLVVMFFLSPFIVHTLGKTGYGIWSLLMVLTGYMGILDLGVRASTGRHIMLYLGKGDHKKVDETIRTGLGVYTAVGGLILLVGLLLGWVFPQAFQSVPKVYYWQVQVLLPILAVNVWISALRTVLSSVLAAHDRFDLARASDLVMLAVRTGGTVLALSHGYGLLGLTVAVVGCNLVGLLANLLLARRVHEGLRLWPLILRRQRLRELMGYGLAAFITAISLRIIGQTDLLIVGALIGVKATTVYAVGAMLLYYSDTLLGQIPMTLFPSIQRSIARGEMGPARWLLFRQIRLAMVLGLPLLLGFILFGQHFIRLWMLGPEFPEESVLLASQVMVVLAASKIPILFRSGATSLLVAMGHIRFTAALTLTQAFVNLGFSLFFVLVLRWGLVGVAAGTLVARLMTSTAILPWYLCRKANLSFSRFALQIGGRGALAGGAFAAACLLMRRVVPGESWTIFWVQVCLALICYVPIATIILVPESDRRRIVGKLLLWRHRPGRPPLKPFPPSGHSYQDRSTETLS